MKLRAGLAALCLTSAFLGLLTATATPADAIQPSCEQGTLVDGKCEIVGDPPIRGAGRCPTGPGIVQAGCYRLVPPLSNGQCPANSDSVGGECRIAVPLVPGDLACRQAGYELASGRCVRYIDPICGPAGCTGTITLAYTVDCLGNGRSRVALGAPKLQNGASISLITLNGSPVVGAELAAGQAVVIQVTPVRPGDQVVVTGPTIAPSCGVAATPTAIAATPIPRPTTPSSTAPTTAPSPAATTAAPADEPTETAVSDDDATESSPTTAAITGWDLAECDAAGERSLTLFASVQPSGPDDSVRWLIDGLPVVLSTSPGEYATFVEADGASHLVELAVVTPADATGDRLRLDFPPCAPEAAAPPETPTSPCAAGEALIQNRCLPPCPVTRDDSAADPAAACYELASEGAAPVVVAETDTVAATSDDGFPIIPVAAIAGATVVLATGAYAVLTQSNGGRRPF